MNSRKIYWFRMPKYPKTICIAVQPFVDPNDGRLVFYVTGDLVWRIPGTMIADTEEKVVFESSKKLDAHGGTYELNLLTLEDFRDWIKEYVVSGDLIANACKSTDDLHYWFRKNWSFPDYWDYVNWQIEENSRKGLRTDTWNRADWTEEERQTYNQEQIRLMEYNEEQKRRLAEYERDHSMKQILLKATKHNWGLKGPGEWEKVTWHILRDRSYEIVSTFGQPMENVEKKITGMMMKEAFDELLEALSVDTWRDSSLNVIACDGVAWEIELYRKDGNTDKLSDKISYIYGHHALKRIVDLLPED